MCKYVTARCRPPRNQRCRPPSPFRHPRNQKLRTGEDKVFGERFGRFVLTGLSKRDFWAFIKTPQIILVLCSGMSLVQNTPPPHSLSTLWLRQNISLHFFFWEPCHCLREEQLFKDWNRSRISSGLPAWPRSGFTGFLLCLALSRLCFPSEWGSPPSPHASHPSCPSSCSSSSPACSILRRGTRVFFKVLKRSR